MALLALFKIALLPPSLGNIGHTNQVSTISVVYGQTSRSIDQTPGLPRSIENVIEDA